MNTAVITIPPAGRAEVAASIEAHGLIHNLLTRKAPKGAKFEVVAGGRRLGALRLLLDEGRTVQGVAVTKDYPVNRWLEDITAVAGHYAFLPEVDLPDLLNGLGYRSLGMRIWRALPKQRESTGESDCDRPQRSCSAGADRRRRGERTNGNHTVGWAKQVGI
ncbi:ParB N-terminal domain-containing protein [Mesorhizobium sp. M0494]|uniref:ParB N-terminal domain-containing protein n=1 Tax=Mesorhizobium sp. M0494 TaxID=2956951 RepID=UPI00333B6D33